MPEHTPAPTPGRAVYGFSMYLAFRICFVLYIIWAVIPEKYFRMIGITCLPQRYWAIAIPVFLLTVLTTFGFIIYPSLGLLMTPNIDDLRTIRDRASKMAKNNTSECDIAKTGSVSECVCKNKDKCFKEIYDQKYSAEVKKPIPVIQDLDMRDISRHLYLK